jgi:hypothetical protein
MRGSNQMKAQASARPFVYAGYRQTQLLPYWSAYSAEHGREPSYNVAARDLGWPDKWTVRDAVKRLRRRGLL